MHFVDTRSPHLSFATRNLYYLLLTFLAQQFKYTPLLFKNMENGVSSLLLQAFFQYLETSSPCWRQLHTCPPGGGTWGKNLIQQKRFLDFSSWKENSNVPWYTIIIFSESRGLYRLPWRSIARGLDGRASIFCALTNPTFPVIPTCSPVLCVNSSAWEAVLDFGRQMPSWHYLWDVSPQGVRE